MILGTVAAAGSIGTFIAAPIAQGLIGMGGWELAMIGFIALCALMLPAAAYVGAGDRPKDTEIPVEPDRSAGLTFPQALGEAGRHRGYVIMAVAFFVCGLQLMFVATHLPAYLVICGQSPGLGAVALAVIGGFQRDGLLPARLARRQVPQAHPARHRLHPALAADRGLFHVSALGPRRRWSSPR